MSSSTTPQNTTTPTTTTSSTLKTTTSTSFTTPENYTTSTSTTPTTSATTTTTTSTMTNDGCHYPQYEGDGSCDDENNHVGCNYDGGDCCPGDDPPSGWNEFCSICQCLEGMCSTKCPFVSGFKLHIFLVKHAYYTNF